MDAGPIDLAAIYTPIVAKIQMGQVFGGQGAFFNPAAIPWEVRARVNRLIAQRAAGSRADVPLGSPVSVGDIAKQPSTSVPVMVAPPARVTTGPVLSTIKPSGRQQTTPNQTFVPTQPTTKRPTMDLGNIIKELGGQYIRTRYGTPQMNPPFIPMEQRPIMVSDTYGRDLPSPTVGMQRPALAQFLPQVAGLGSSVGKIALSIAAAMGVTEITEEILIAAQAASKVKCRRKRRRLATHSDIKDLAALKAVLGTGKAFDTWIATRKM